MSKAVCIAGLVGLVNVFGLSLARKIQQIEVSSLDTNLALLAFALIRVVCEGWFWIGLAYLLPASAPRQPCRSWIC